MNDGGSAFPATGTIKSPPTQGMTLRDWFAGQALAGYLASKPDHIAHQVAKISYGIADEMLKKRTKNT